MATNLFHNTTETEYRLVYIGTLLRAFKIEEKADEIIDIIHDAQIKSFEIDNNVEESQRKEEYNIEEVFSNRYFSGGSTRRGSQEVNKIAFIAIVNKVMSSLCKKMDGFYSIAMSKDEYTVAVDFTIPEIDFTGLTFRDDNYGLYRVYREVNALSEDRKKNAYFCFEDDYSCLSQTTYSDGNLILHLSINIGNCPMSNISKFLGPLFDEDSVRNMILSKIN